LLHCNCPVPLVEDVLSVLRHIQTSGSFPMSYRFCSERYWHLPDSPAAVTLDSDAIGRLVNQGCFTVERRADLQLTLSACLYIHSLAPMLSPLDAFCIDHVRAVLTGSNRSGRVPVATAPCQIRGWLSQGPSAPRMSWQRASQVHPARSPPSPAAVPAAVPPARLCPICLTAEPDTALVPCGHTVCSGCEPQMRISTDSCPVCRAYVAQTVKLFFA
jgi:hypothetical protein